MWWNCHPNFVQGHIKKGEQHLGGPGGRKLCTNGSVRCPGIIQYPKCLSWNEWTEIPPKSTKIYLVWLLADCGKNQSHGTFYQKVSRKSTIRSAAPWVSPFDRLSNCYHRHDWILFLKLNMKNEESKFLRNIFIWGY